MRRNIVISFAQKHLQLLINIGSVMILSRLISPEETGIFSIGVAIAAITHAVRDFGVGNFLIKETDMSTAKIQTAFTVSFLIAAGLAAVLLAVSIPVGNFYKQPEVTTIIIITTVGLLISPFSTVSLALMLREQRFVDMLKVSMIGAVFNAAVAIAFAWMGYGAKALALGALSSSVAIVVLANILLRYEAIYRFSLHHWREISRFGAHMTVFGVAEQLGQRASDLVVGKLLGFSSVGLLSRSGSLITMMQDSVVSSAMPVVLTSMAADNRRTGDVVPLMLTSIQYFTVITWPFFVVLSLFSTDVVMVLFGERWIEAAPYMSILSYGACFAVLSSLVGTVCNATGRVDLLSRYGLMAQANRVILIAAGCLLGGLKTVVMFLVLAEVLQCVLAYYIVRRAVAVRFLDIVRCCWKAVAVGLIVGAAMLPLTHLQGAPVWRLLCVGVVATVCWVASAFALRHPIAAQLHHVASLASAKLRPQRQP